MKKIFTLIFGLIGLCAAANAAGIDDLVKINQTYDMIADKWNKGAAISKGTIFGDGHFLAVNGLNYANNKGSWNANFDLDSYNAKEFYNSMRVKKVGDCMAFKAVGGSTIKVWGERHASRPLIIEADGKVIYTAATTANEPKDDEGNVIWALGMAGYAEVKLADDATVKIYSEGDLYIGRVLVEVPVQPGQPVPTVGEQTKGADGVWFKEVSCVADVNGTACELFYTTDGNDPDNTSAKYVAPLKITKDCTVKFTSYLGARKIMTSSAPVSFEFAAPSLVAEGNVVTITNAENIDGDIMASINGAEYAKYEAPITLEKSASVAAYTVIKNAENDFVSLSKSIEVLLIKPLAENQILAVEGEFEEGDPDDAGNPTYVIDAKVNYNDEYIYYRGFTLKAVPATADQVVVDGNRYPVAFQLNDPGKLTFMAPEGKDVVVKVWMSRNSHKNDDDMRCGFGITPAGGKIEYVINGTYADGVTDGGVDENNVVEYTAAAGNTYTISKWNNTGNVFISYMTFELKESDGIANVTLDAAKNGAIYNLAGQKVGADFKGIVIMNGKKVIK